MNSLRRKPQLFLLHFAGGNRYSFDFMRPSLPDWEFIPVELPGRGRRVQESLLNNFHAAAADLFGQILAYRKPVEFLLFGHSLGAMMALKLAGMFESVDKPPVCIVVSGNAGPGISSHSASRALDKESIRKEVRSLGGAHKSVLDTDDIYDFYYPILKADFELARGRDFVDVPAVKVPIHAIAGREEEAAGYLDNWRRFTSSHFTKEILPGNHFFIYKHPDRIAEIINNCKTLCSSERS